MLNQRKVAQLFADMAQLTLNDDKMFECVQRQVRECRLFELPAGEELHAASPGSRVGQHGLLCRLIKELRVNTSAKDIMGRNLANYVIKWYQRATNSVDGSTMEELVSRDLEDLYENTDEQGNNMLLLRCSTTLPPTRTGMVSERRLRVKLKSIKRQPLPVLGRSPQ